MDVIEVQEVGSGACAHGASLVYLDRTVVFTDECSDCSEVLRSDGYTVREPVRALALSA